jgi:hypothetical protein
MTDVEAARAEIRGILRELKPLKFRLLGVAASLPPSSAETSPLLDVEPADLGTEIRSVVECVVNDSFGPAIRDLEEVAGGGGEEG